VSSLVVLEASPDTGTPAEIDDHVAALTRSLESWPVPFKTRTAALEYWGGRSVRAQAWVSGLIEADDGLRPRFDIGVMARTLREAVGRSYWPEWEGLPMDALLVRGSDGGMPREAAVAMAGRARHASLVDIPDAGHDVHLEQPRAWRLALTQFLERSGAGTLTA
jgi:pimeloyl-ACP methyl ester carboxylesterase